VRSPSGNRPPALSARIRRSARPSAGLRRSLR
jgi:hypothetical protein